MIIIFPASFNHPKLVDARQWSDVFSNTHEYIFKVAMTYYGYRFVAYQTVFEL